MSIEYSHSDKKNKIIRSIDIQNIEYNDKGVIDFYWPLDNKDASQVMECVIKELIPFITEHKKKNPELLAISLLFKWFLSEVLRIFESAFLVSQFKKNNIIPVIPKNYRKFSAFYFTEHLECDFFLNNANGPVGGRKIPLTIKRIAKDFLWNGLNIKLLLKYKGRKSEILSIAPSQLAIKHANKTKKLLRYSSFEEWFGPIPKEIITQKKTDQALLQKILNSIEKSFEDNGCQLPKAGKDFLINWIEHANNFVNYYLNQENFKYENITNEVWFGSGGNTIWHVILIERLRRKGIKIVTHDHGSGNSHHDQIPVHWVEFMHTDQFITFNKINEINRNNQFNKKLIFGQNIPKIQSLDSQLGIETKKIKKRVIQKSNRIKKIMYVGTAYHGETTRLRPIFHDITYFDWQIKLLSYLKNHGVNGFYKPHPEGATRPRSDFAESFGFKTLNQRLEAISENFDAYIIDFIFSSTTPLILKSDKPVFFINLGFPELLVKPKDLIKKRCYYFEAIYSRDSRLNIDWERFSKFLNIKNHEFTMDFPDLYFQNQ